MRRSRPRASGTVRPRAWSCRRCGDGARRASVAAAVAAAATMAGVASRRLRRRCRRLLAGERPRSSLEASRCYWFEHKAKRQRRSMAGLGHKRGRGGGWPDAMQAMRASPFHARWFTLLPPSSFLSSRHHGDRHDTYSYMHTLTKANTLPPSLHSSPLLPHLLARTSLTSRNDIYAREPALPPPASPP